MIAELIHRTLTTEIAPMVYVMMFVSLFIGLSFATGLFVDTTDSVLYSTGVLMDPRIWGWFLSGTAASALVGFVTDNNFLISLGGLGGFMAWLFASLSLILAAQWYVLISVGLFHLIFHGYITLSAPLGYLRRGKLK